MLGLSAPPLPAAITVSSSLLARRTGLAVPELVVHALTVPHRKQGRRRPSDGVGAGLEPHLRERELVVIVSRDDLVIGAAEQAKAYGCRTLIAYVDSEIPTARNPHSRTTLLLPAFAKPLDSEPPGLQWQLRQLRRPGTVTSVLSHNYVACDAKDRWWWVRRDGCGPSLVEAGLRQGLRRHVSWLPCLVWSNAALGGRTRSLSSSRCTRSKST